MAGLTVAWSVHPFYSLTVFSISSPCLVQEQQANRFICFQKLFTSTTTSVQVRTARNFWTELPYELLILNNNVEIDVRLFSCDYFPKSKALKIIFSIVTISHHWPRILPRFVIIHFAKIASDFFTIIKKSQICNCRFDFKLENVVMTSEIGRLVWTLEVKCILGRMELKVGWCDWVIPGPCGILEASTKWALLGSASGIGLRGFWRGGGNNDGQLKGLLLKICWIQTKAWKEIHACVVQGVIW